MKYEEVVALQEKDVFNIYESSREGLSDDEVVKRRIQYGYNTIKDRNKHSWVYFLFNSFRDEFIIVLLLLSLVSFFLKDHLGAIIILVLSLISALIRFVQDFSSYQASEKLKTLVHTHVNVRRNNQMVEINREDLVIGDLVELGSGSVIGADLYVLESKDLFISQSLFTGESLAVEKKVHPQTDIREVTEYDNLCLMGSSVVSGSGLGLVIKIGKDTYLGKMAIEIDKTKEETNFEKGLKSVSSTLVKYMIVVVLMVFFINGLVKGDWVMAFMFAISVAVGITPGMLPMIVNGTLAKGAQSLSKQKIIVKHLGAIQNLGAIDILCTDKTGTLTLDRIVLQRYLNIHGLDDASIFEYAYLNSFYSTGIKNLIDRAILDYKKNHFDDSDYDVYTKVDEIPFDYERKRMSVVLKDKNDNISIVTKGALEEVIGICTFAKEGDTTIPMSDVLLRTIQENADFLNDQGMHVIVIAEKKINKELTHYAESEMCFIGFLAFLDPPKPHVHKAIERLYSSGISIKVLTGDAALVAKNVCTAVGIKSEKILTGKDLEVMNDDDIKKVLDEVNIFARLAPMQKERIVRLLRDMNHVTGYLGDGVNDAPSLRSADVGISVDSATDIAKEHSDMILLEKNLNVLVDGVYEGRRIYGNITKYMKMSLSSNVGNVVSVLVSSVFLPFLPMIPIQILIQNLIYDMSQIAIPWDNVDESFIEKPKRWDMRDLVRFMNVMGTMSTLFDFATFSLLWFGLSFNSIEFASSFQTGWFIQGLISQTLIVHFIRTQKVPFVESIANRKLLFSTSAGIILALFIPYLLHSIPNFNFVLMPLNYYFYLVIILFTYAFTIEAVKRIYIKHYGTWL